MCQIVLDCRLGEVDPKVIETRIVHWQHSLGEAESCIVDLDDPDNLLVIVPDPSAATADVALTDLDLPHHIRG
jgi:hypothetical protein